MLLADSSSMADQEKIKTIFTPTLGLVIEGKTYAWTDRVDEAAILARRVGQKSGQIVTGLAFGATGFSFIFFVFTGLLADGVSLFSLSYWFEPSLGGFFFSLSFLFACFSFFRFISVKQIKSKVPTPPDEAVAPDVVPVPIGTRENIADRFDPDARKLIEDAFALASKYGHKEMLPIHIFGASLSLGSVPVVFGRLGLKFNMVGEPLGRRLGMQQLGTPTVISKQAEEIFLAAFSNAYLQARDRVSSVELMFEAYRRDEFVKELLFDAKVDEERMTNVVEWVRITGKLRERLESFKKASFFKPTGSVNRAYTSTPTPLLDSVSEDLTTAAVSGYLPMLIGRDQEMRSLLRVVEGGGQGVVLVGSSGVGKSAILSGIAWRMVEERVPKIFQDKRLISLSIPRLLSGASASEAQDRLLRALSEAVRAGNIVLVIPNLEQLTGVSPGGEQTADVAAILSDILSKGLLPTIATSTPDAYAALIEQGLLGQVFQKVDIIEPDVTTAIRILESKIGGIEYQNHVIFSYEAVDQAVKLSDRYMHESYLPKKAIEICNETALAISKTRGKDAFITGEDVAKIISEKTHIPVTQVNAKEKETLLGLEEKMHNRVIGQEEAVTAVSKALRRARAELRSEDRPIATFLFMGPTGVGKTELAKTVAETYFGNEKAMIRLDMSEYQDVNSISKMIGVPGSKEGGQLTEAVRRNPFSIVLLDEFEKAHPDILNIFLQVFDDGRLTDSSGRTIDFTNTIIVATSNAGTEYIQDSVAKGESLETIKTHLLEEELRGIYRPELLNRFDGVIVFKPLTQENVVEIAKLMIVKVAARLEPKGIGFKATDEAIRELAKKGYDPKFGARPLRRVIQEEVDSAIAEALLEGRVGRRDIIVLNPGGVIEIEKAKSL